MSYRTEAKHTLDYACRICVVFACAVTLVACGLLSGCKREKEPAKLPADLVALQKRSNALCGLAAMMVRALPNEAKPCPRCVRYLSPVLLFCSREGMRDKVGLLGQELQLTIGSGRADEIRTAGDRLIEVLRGDWLRKLNTSEKSTAPAVPGK